MQARLDALEPAYQAFIAADAKPDRWDSRAAFDTYAYAVARAREYYRARWIKRLAWLHLIEQHESIIAAAQRRGYAPWGSGVRVLKF